MSDTHIAGAPLQPGQLDAADVDQQDIEQGPSRFERLMKRWERESYAVMASRLLQLRLREARLKKFMADITEEIEVIAIKTIPTRFAADGFKTLNLAGIGRIQLASDAYCTVQAGMGEELQEWLRRNGHGDLIKPTVNPSTLKSFVKELAKDAAEAAGEFDPASALEDPIQEVIDEETDEVIDTRPEFEQVQDYVNFTPFIRASVVKTRG